MNTKHTDRLIAVILFHDMECVLTREIIEASMEGMSNYEALVHLQTWAISLVENCEFLMEERDEPVGK